MRGNLLQFSRGAVFAACTPTGNFDVSSLMEKTAPFLSQFVAAADGEPHMRQAVDAVSAVLAQAEGGRSMVGTSMANVWIEPRPVYAMQRDEDGENMYHTMADFLNAFLVYNLLGLRPETTNVLVMDGKPDGPYWDLIRRGYSRLAPPRRFDDPSLKGRIVFFRRLVLHLESPASIIFPDIQRGRMSCTRSPIVEGFRRHVLSSFDLLNVPPPPIPTVTVSLRRRTPQKNVGRIMANEDAVISMVRSEGNLMRVAVADFGAMSFADQLALARNTTVLMGVHGAGLMHVLFMADEGALVEVHPSYRLDRHFRHAARLVGRDYLPLRSMEPVSCHGSSDNVPVPLDELRRAMDGALRLARNYYGGLSECGFTCDPRILALDGALDPFYLPHEQRAPKPSTHFPCGR